MLNRARRNVHCVIPFTLAVGILLFSCSALHATGRDPVDQPLYDIVAVGRGQGQILLATLASPAEQLRWRIRRIPLSPSNKTAADVVLSVSGTKALVALSDGTVQVLDLTKRITQISAGDVPAFQHRLPQQIFPYAKNGELCLLDDLGQPTKDGCSSGLAAVVHEDGRVLYALKDGRLVVGTPQTGAQEELPYRLARGADFQLLAGHRGDARDFLLLITEASADQTGSSVARVTKIIDPRIPNAPIGQFANPAVAALRAQIDFSSVTSPAAARGSAEPPSDAILESLAANLREQTHSAELIWSFYRVKANNGLYAPVLEFAEAEPDYPSDVNFWEEIKPLAHGNSAEDYRTAYASMGNKRWSRCTIYVRMLSFPGTWVIEYWFYYPFDEGKAHPHIHDSEHFFVEVDKLGGTVRNVFASDHDSFVPNNIFSTLVKNAPPVTLPLFATAELGKHAMAPDMDHDGRFTRGVDDNLHIEPYSFWGLRDRSTKFHFMMEPYLKSMSLPHTRDGRFALADAEIYFPGLDVPADHMVCALQPFPSELQCTNCGVTSAEAATAFLVDHPDARVPEGIYKPFVVPWRDSDRNCSHCTGGNSFGHHHRTIACFLMASSRRDVLET